MASVDFDLGTLERATALSGILDQNIRLLENEFNVKIAGRGQQISINGEESNVTAASQAVEEMLNLYLEGESDVFAKSMM